MSFEPYDINLTTSKNIANKPTINASKNIPNESCEIQERKGHPQMTIFHVM